MNSFSYIKTGRLLQIAVILFLSSFHAGHAGSGVSGWPLLDLLADAVSETFVPPGEAGPGPDRGRSNPATLCLSKGRVLRISADLPVQGLNAGSVEFSLPVEMGTFVFSGGYLNAGSVELNWTDTTGEYTRTESAENDFLGTVSFSRRLGGRVLFGVSGKALHSRLIASYSASALAYDAGVAVYPASRLSVSLFASNLGLSTAYISEDIPLPVAAAGQVQGLILLNRLALTPAIAIRYAVADETYEPCIALGAACEGYSLSGQFLPLNQESPWSVSGGLSLRNIGTGYRYLHGIRLEGRHSVFLTWSFSPPSSKGAPE